jgi:excreted virulence factor EspC (type VII ESX diderm)
MMDRIADRLDLVADALTTVDRSVPALAVTPDAFGADDTGVPGRLGHDLHARWTAVLDARAREAADTAARLTGLAQSLRATAKDYTDTDDEAARRVQRRA